MKQIPLLLRTVACLLGLTLCRGSFVLHEGEWKFIDTVSMYASGDKHLDNSSYISYPSIVTDCSGDTFNATLASDLEKSSGLKVVVFVAACNIGFDNGGQIPQRPVWGKIYGEKSVGATGLADDEVEDLGYYYKRKGMEPYFSNVSFPTFFYRVSDMKPKVSSSPLFTLINGHNHWVDLMRDKNTALGIDVLGSLSVVNVLFAAASVMLYRYTLRRNAAADRRDTASPTSSGTASLLNSLPSYNLMVAILLIEGVSNVLRAIIMFGCGMSVVEGRFIGILILFVTSSLPFILLQANSIILSLAWARSRQMKMGEINKQLFMWHGALVTVLTIVDFVRTGVLWGITSANEYSETFSFATFYLAVNFFYVMLYVTFIVVFIRSAYTMSGSLKGSVAMKQQSTNSSQDSKIQQFNSRLKKLAFGFGTSNILGIVSFMYMQLIGRFADPYTYSYSASLTQLFPLVSSFFLMNFASDSLLNTIKRGTFIAPAPSTKKSEEKRGTGGGKVSSLAGPSAVSTDGRIDSKRISMNFKVSDKPV